MFHSLWKPLLTCTKRHGMTSRGKLLWLHSCLCVNSFGQQLWLLSVISYEYFTPVSGIWTFPTVIPALNISFLCVDLTSVCCTRLSAFLDLYLPTECWLSSLDSDTKQIHTLGLVHLMQALIFDPWTAVVLSVIRDSGKKKKINPLGWSSFMFELVIKHCHIFTIMKTHILTNYTTITNILLSFSSILNTTFKHSQWRFEKIHQPEGW